MAEKHVKVAISIPSDDFLRVEKLRKQLKLSRSEFMLTAVRRWFTSTEQELLIERYTAGYLSKPEDPSSIIALEQMQVEQVGGESW